MSMAPPRCLVCDRTYRDLEGGSADISTLVEYAHRPLNRENLGYNICRECAYGHAGIGGPLPGEVATWFAERDVDEKRTRWMWLQLPDSAETILALTE